MSAAKAWRPPVDEKAIRNKVEEAMQTVVEGLAQLGATDAAIAGFFRGAREFQEDLYQEFHPTPSPDWADTRTEDIADGD